MPPHLKHILGSHFRLERNAVRHFLVDWVRFLTRFRDLRAGA